MEEGSASKGGREGEREEGREGGRVRVREHEGAQGGREQESEGARGSSGGINSKGARVIKEERERLRE